MVGASINLKNIHTKILKIYHVLNHVLIYPYTRIFGLSSTMVKLLAWASNIPMKKAPLTPKELKNIYVYPMN